VVFLTLWMVALARAAGEWDFGVGAPHSGRVRPELHNLVGLFVNTVVIRSGLAPDLSFADAVTQVERVCREGFARHAVPFEAVADAAAPERDMSGTPLFQTLFALSGDGMVGQVPRERDLDLLGQGWKSARADLALTLWPNPDGGYAGALEYATALYDESVVTGLAEQLRVLAERFADDPDQAIGAGLPDSSSPVDEPEHLETVLGFVRELLPPSEDGSQAGPDDDFISLGGTSLLVARLLWNVQSVFGVEVSMRVFFDLPTAAELTRCVRELLADGS
jgi:non-ribosomal peptide synthetase component F